MKKILQLIAILLFTNMLSAQTLLQKADSLFNEKDYYNSLQQYNKALKKAKPEEGKYINFQIGECYRYANNYLDAKTWYEKAISAGYDAPAVQLHIGEMQLLAGDYADAKTSIEKYLQVMPDDKIAKIRLESCNLGLKGQAEKPLYEVKLVKDISSTASDYGIAFFNMNKMIFASTRMEGSGKVDPSTLQGYSDLYETSFDALKGTWSKPVKLAGKINTKYNEGTFTYNLNTGDGYYMQCKWESGKKTNCNILVCHYNERSNTWEEPKLFDFNSQSYSVGHPSLSSDGKTMYFVSDMPGGYGGSDIYVIKKKGSEWGKPENLGPTINTAGEETFPFISGDTLLTFASDRHPGFGGLDIFMCTIKGGKISEPVNMMQPINSSADDFNLIFKYDKNNGYFCSNRTGGVGDDDIYSYHLIPVILSAQGNIKDKATGKSLENAVATFKGSDGSMDSVYTDSKGNYEFDKLKPNVNYAVRATKDGYLNDSKNFSVENEKYSKTYNRETGFNLDLELIKKTKEEVKIDNIYYDYDKWDLRPDAKAELDKLINVLKETPDVYVQISSHTDERGAVDYNMELSQKRAQAVVDYLIASGVSGDQLIAMGYGFSNPIVKNARTEEQHQKNRRTTFKILTSEEFAKISADAALQVKTNVPVKTPVTKSEQSNEIKSSTKEANTSLPGKAKMRKDSSQVKMNETKQKQEVSSNISTSENKYFIIVGAFPTKQKAEDAIKSLKANGYPLAELVGQAPNGNWRVAYKGFVSKEDAQSELESIKLTNSSAWMYEKK